MQKSQIDIRFGWLFPWPFLLLAAVGFIIAISLIVTHSIISICLMLGCLAILTAHSGTEIKKQERQYREYTSFLSYKLGKFSGYGQIEKIFINSSKRTQRLATAHTNQTSVFTFEGYNAWLKFSNGEKIHLMRKPNKITLLRKMEKVVTFLETHVEDTTLNTPNIV